MNKSALKNFATKARLELMGMVSTRVDYLLGLGADLPIALKDDVDNISAIRERCSSDGQIDKDKREGFIEEVAYTWFNRLIALRFMDANAITESRVVSPLDGQTLPEIFNEAKGGTISKDLVLDRDKFYDIIDGKIPSDNPDNEAYKMLFISVCNHYNKLMPFMFESISDYTELLLPDDMLSSNSIRAKVIEAMSEEDCQDIEVIGWLYQFYISEKKDDVFAKLKKNQKITPSNIPAATQLFTPHWIVKYMVENSLGKLWMLNNPNSSLKENMKYYIENEEETTTFIKVTSPEEITFLDPCCGSGHTLTYAFDLLTAIYEEEGYNKSEIPSLILENNLFGCDIDKRASVLANFALTMKARQYHKRFFKKDVKPNIVELEDYGSDEFAGIKNFGSLLVPYGSASFDDGIFAQSTREYDIQKKILSSEFHCVVTNPPYMGSKGMNKELSDFVKKRYPDSKSDLMTVFLERCIDLTKEDGFMSMIILPSWLFLSSFEKLRKKLVDNYIIDSLLHMGRGIFGIDWGSTSFTLQNSKPLGKTGSYFRLHQRTFQHIYYEDIGLIFLNALNDHTYKYNFELYRNEEDGIRAITPQSDNNGLQIFYKAKQEDFSKIPAIPIAYWVSDNVKSIFENNQSLSDISLARIGLQTGDNNRFTRQWYEVNKSTLGFNIRDKNETENGKYTWFPYNKGGEYRKWFGNGEIIVNWQYNGKKIIEFGTYLNSIKKPSSRMGIANNSEFYFKESISWSKVTSGGLALRYFPNGYIFDVAGSSIFPNDKKDMFLIMSLFNSAIKDILIKPFNPTLNYEAGKLLEVPVIFPEQDSVKQNVDSITQQNIDISKEEWDSRETSWDFTKSELIKHKSNGKVETAFNNYSHYWSEKFVTLHRNEEELNKIFIDIYGLSDELDEYVDFEDITILKNETKIEHILIPASTIDEAEERAQTPEGYLYNSGAQLVFKADEIMRQFISYGVGVMFGRYSLDSDGLLIANMGQDVPTSTTFEIDDDNVIPVLEDDYFTDDIASRFVQFVKATFGEEDLSENIRFIEESLGTTIRKYFVKGFYEDHIKRYKKRPIYWMVASPKKGFMSLMYLHRYQSDVFARVQNGYLREYITKLEATLNAQAQITNDEGNSTKVRKDAQRQIDNIHKKLDEIIMFDRDKLTAFAQGKTDIDLDDGVKVNYCKFKDVLYPITGLCK